MSSYSVIIPAAGSGSRMGASIPKVLLPLQSVERRAGSSILRHTVSIFARDRSCKRIVVCVPDAWRSRFETEVTDLANVTLVAGGDTRQASVHCGVELLAGIVGADGEREAVLVHDAARVCVKEETISRVVAGVYQHGAVTAAVRVVDSLCRAEGDLVGGYISRDDVWAIQTPQGFWLSDLLVAHRNAKLGGISVSDDAALVGLSRRIHLIEGDRQNVKVTMPEDLEIARRIIHQGVVAHGV